MRFAISWVQLALRDKLGTACARGDRACLALGQFLGLPVLTTDRAWADLELGINVQVIR
ncbi:MULTISPECIES: PIN domain-containing protein [Nostocales]|uniref:hypothetical protein n=1 Tax=Nostocales TaxID=1161 RepID=UPI000AC1C098